MPGEGRKEFPDEASLCTSTFADNTIINTSVGRFAGRSGLAQWQSSGQSRGPIGVNPGGGPRNHREIAPKPPLDEAVRADDTFRATIGRD
jgi:hypothetical protein